MNDNRVLARTGARELTTQEIDQVSAAQFHTNVCTGALALTHTGGDGDGCSDTDHTTF